MEAERSPQIHLDKKKETTTIKTEPLTYSDKLFLKIEEEWIMKTLSAQRDVGKVILNLIGIFFGFYTVTLSISIGTGLDIKSLSYSARITGSMPLVLWILSMFFALFSVKPFTVKVGKSLNELKKDYHHITRKVGILINMAMLLFTLGVVWFLGDIWAVFFLN